MKIFFFGHPQVTLSKEEHLKRLLLRERCARIVCAAWSFGSSYRDLVREECLESGFDQIDDDDYLHLSDFANLNGSTLFTNRPGSVLISKPIK